MLVMSINLCGFTLGGAYFAAEDSPPIESPVDDSFFARGKSFFCIHYLG